MPERRPQPERRHAKSEADYQARFWSKVSGGDVTTCWVWQAGGTADGYGHFFIWAGKKRAHRLSYEWLIGPIPEGLHLDHLCRNRACVNPWHLEPVTAQVNSQRGETGLAMKMAAAARATCGFGHPWTEENTYQGPTRSRVCRECSRIRDRRRTRTKEQAERRAARAARTCSVEDCPEPFSSKGYCKVHAARVRRNGQPYLQSEVAA